MQSPGSWTLMILVAHPSNTEYSMTLYQIKCTVPDNLLSSEVLMTLLGYKGQLERKGGLFSLRKVCRVLLLLHPLSGDLDAVSEMHRRQDR